MADKKKVEALRKLYSLGELSPKQTLALEKLSDLGELDFDLPGYKSGVEEGYRTTDPGTMITKSLSSGLLGLGALPVTAVESLFKLGNIGLEKAGVSEDYRIPVSDLGLAGTIEEALPNSFVAPSEQIRPDLKPFNIFGEIAGGAVGGAGVVGGLARALPRVIGKTATGPGALETPGVLQSAGRGMLESFRQAPARTMATETGFGAAAGVGGALAEEIAPGSPTASVVGQTLATLTPAGIATRFAPSAINQMRTIVETKIPFVNGGKIGASRVVQEALIKEGESPSDFAARIEREAGKLPGTLTSGQIAGSKALNALEKSLINENKAVRQQYGKLAEDSFSEFNNLYLQAIQGGDPNALKQAAQVRKDYLEGLLENRMGRAEAAAREASGELDAATADVATNASLRAREILEDALSVARKTENQLWREIPQDLDIVPSNLAAAFNVNKFELLDDLVQMPSPVSQFGRKAADMMEDQPVGELEDLLVKTFGGKAPDVDLATMSSGDILTFRSMALTKATDLRSGAKPNRDMARRVQSMADAALKDLKDVAGDVADTARSFSRKLNKKFTEGYTANVLATTSRGAAIEPELTLQRAMGVGGPTGAVRARQLREAAEPIEGAPVTPETMFAPGDMRKTQQQFLTSMASQIRNRNTGNVDPAALNKFISNNATMIKNLGLEETFRNAETTRKFANALVSRSKKASAFFDKKKVAGRFINNENPDAVVSDIILRSNNPGKDFNNLVKLARTDKTGEAMDGLRASVFETVLSNSSKSKGFPTSTEIDLLLNKKFGSQTLQQIMLQTGVVTKAQMSNLNRLKAQSKRFEDSLFSIAVDEDSLVNDSAIMDVLAAALGSNLATKSPISSGLGAGLVVAQAGAKAARQQLLKLPVGKVNDVLVQAMFDHKLMADLLQRGNLTVRNKINSRIEAYLVNNLIIDEEDLEE